MVVHMMMLVADGSNGTTRTWTIQIRVHFEYMYVHHLRLSDLP